MSTRGKQRLVSYWLSCVVARPVRMLKRGELKLGNSAEESVVWQRAQKKWRGKEWRPLPEGLFELLKMCEMPGLTTTKQVRYGASEKTRTQVCEFQLPSASNPDEYVFKAPGRASPITSQKIKEATLAHAKKYAKEMDEPNFSYIQTKSERTSRATLMTTLQIPADVIMEALRMTNESTLQTYVRLGPQQMPMNPAIKECANASATSAAIGDAGGDASMAAHDRGADEDDR